MSVKRIVLSCAVASILVMTTGCSTASSEITLSENISDPALLEKRAEETETRKFQNTESFSIALTEAGFMGYTQDKDLNKIPMYTIFHTKEVPTIEDLHAIGEILIDNGMVNSPDDLISVKFENKTLPQEDQIANLSFLLETNENAVNYLKEEDTKITLPTKVLTELQ